MDDLDEATNGIRRLKVFDNNEFDIMPQDEVNMSRTHKGKGNSEIENLNQLKDDRAKLRDTLSKLRMVKDSEGIYDDEYDDTYDDYKDYCIEHVCPGELPVGFSEMFQGEKVSGRSKGKKGRKAKIYGFVMDPEVLRTRPELSCKLLPRDPRWVRTIPPSDEDLREMLKYPAFKPPITTCKTDESTYDNPNRCTGAQRKREGNMGFYPG